MTARGTSLLGAKGDNLSGPVVVALVTLLVAGGAVAVGVRSYHAANARPAACSAVAVPLGQLATDISANVKQAATGGSAQSPGAPLDPTPVLNDTQTVASLVAASPGSFAAHLQPVVDASNKLVDDGRRGGSSTAELVGVATAIRQAAVWCRVPGVPAH